MKAELQRRIQLESYWNDIPIGASNPVTYDQLCLWWGANKRTVRRILQELSGFDNGDNFVLIRSGQGKGFFKTDNPLELFAYKKECLNKGRSIFAPIKKINRVLGHIEDKQWNAFNNLKGIRESKGILQTEVCKYMKQFDRSFDASLLSKMENGVCLPTPYQLRKLAVFYGVRPSELVITD